MKVVHLSRADIDGGAARAANRLHRAMVALGKHSQMLVDAKRSDDWRVLAPSGMAQQIAARVIPRFDALVASLQGSADSALRSPGAFGRISARAINLLDVDIVNLHWVCQAFMRVETLAGIRKPIVWTLHDMWAFCGAEHYAPDDMSARWRTGYTDANRRTGDRGFDVDRWTWRRKLKTWRQRMHVIAPTQWMAECARASVILRDCPVTVIPNVIDLSVYRPLPKQLAREILGIPPDAKLVLFGAIGGQSDPRKGWDLLAPALAAVAARMPGLRAIVLGQSEPRQPPSLGLPIHWAGHLYDDVALALAYSAADVTVVPSRQDNLPQSATEAQGCGCPVVAFRTAGLCDVVEHGATGYLAEPFDSESLAKGIEWVLIDSQRHAQLAARARERSLRLWSADAVVPQYLQIYAHALQACGKAA